MVRLPAVAAVAAVVVCAAAGCTRTSPAAAVQALASAARDGDRAEVESLLGPRTRQRLADEAHVASDQAGRRRLSASDLLAVGWVAPTEEFEEVVEVERSGDRAVVELRGKRGGRERVEVVKSGGAWLVELP